MEYAARSIRLGSLDVAQVVDKSRYSGLGIKVLVLCTIVMLFDGFDIQSITFVAPLLKADFGIGSAELGVALSSGLLGTTIGALALGPVADRFGRKLVLCGCLLTFGLCSLAMATSQSITHLALWRLLGGVGLGGTTAAALALTADYCPARLRVTATMIVACGYPVGAGGGALIAAELIQTHGWRSVFLLGGVAPLLVLVVIIAFMPASFLDLARRGDGAKMRALLRQIDPSIAISEGAVPQTAARARKFPIAQLFADGRAWATSILWLTFFMSILALYFMVSWLPTLAHEAGFPLVIAVRAAAMTHIGSVLGTLVLAVLVRRYAPFKVIAVGYALGVVTLLLLALSSGSLPLFMTIAFLAGFFVVGTQTGANAASGVLYPAEIRSTGIGWALGIGRLGSIVGPLLGGTLLALHWPINTLFVVIAIPAAIASLGALLLFRLLKASETRTS